ncbi:acidic amino acid decarboxylase GADL1 [Procambarus clarkii]|uniref:acidic amino acid decarboxylase GADL1 n=1 Tax=Procambarus clarkii TaxID=6728 RepID=UPI0037425322
MFRHCARRVVTREWQACPRPAASGDILTTGVRAFRTTSMADDAAPSASVADADGRLLEKVLALVHRQRSAKEPQKVVEFVHPLDLQKLLALRVGSSAASLAEAEEVLEQIMRYSVMTSHPHFYNQLYGGISEVSLAGAWIVEALNTNQHTFEVAPVFTMVEHFVIARLVQLFGWHEGDGIFSPGELALYLCVNSGTLDGTSGPPKGTSGPPKGTSDPPEGTSGPPKGTSDPPEGTSGPPEGTSGPPEGTSGPPEGTSGPPEGTSGPPEGTRQRAPSCPSTITGAGHGRREESISERLDINTYSVLAQNSAGKDYKQ